MYCEPLLLITMKEINRETFFVFFKYSVFPRNSHNTVNAHCSSYRNDSYNFCDIRRLGNCAHVVYLQCHHDGNFFSDFIQFSKKFTVIITWLVWVSIRVKPKGPSKKWEFICKRNVI